MSTNRKSETIRENSRTQASRGSAPKASAKTDSTGTVEVLYQKMGDRWFAFSLIENEVFVGSISQEEIDRKKASKRNKGRAGSA